MSTLYTIIDTWPFIIFGFLSLQPEGGCGYLPGVKATIGIYIRRREGMEFSSGELWRRMAKSIQLFLGDRSANVNAEFSFSYRVCLSFHALYKPITKYHQSSYHPPFPQSHINNYIPALTVIIRIILHF